MSNPRDDRPDLSPESEAFVDRVSEEFAPAEPSPARAQAFDVALQERLEAPTRQPWIRPALVTAAIGAAIGWLLLPADPQPPEQSPQILAEQVEPEAPDPFDFASLDDPIEAVPSDPADWADELLGASDIEEFDASSDDALASDARQAAGSPTRSWTCAALTVIPPPFMGGHRRGRNLPEVPIPRQGRSPAPAAWRTQRP